MKDCLLTGIECCQVKQKERTFWNNARTIPLDAISELFEKQFNFR